MSNPDERQLDFRQQLLPAPLPQAPLTPAQRLACLRLIRSEGVGPVTFRDLINHFGGAEEALATLPALNRRAGRPSARICPPSRAQDELDDGVFAGAGQEVGKAAHVLAAAALG